MPVLGLSTMEELMSMGVDATNFDNTLYYNANINEDRQAAFYESKRFLDAYYTTDWPQETIDLWVAYGSPQEVIEKIQSFVDARAKEVTIRLTAYNQREQLERLMKEVIPAFQKVRTT